MAMFWLKLGPPLLPSCELAAVDFSMRFGLPPKHSNKTHTPWSVFQDGQVSFFIEVNSVSAEELWY